MIRQNSTDAVMNKELQYLKRNPMVQEMKKYIQHGTVSTYEHCERVARLSCAINKKLHLGADVVALTRGAMLHDFYLYDWHLLTEHQWRHGFHHPEIAAQNAERYIGINEIERKIIQSHMWPYTLTKIPECKEAWIVCFADKWCSLEETLFMRKSHRS